MPNKFKLSIERVEEGDNAWVLLASSAHSMYTEVFDNRAVKAVLSKDGDYSTFTISSLPEPAPLVNIELAVHENIWCEVENVFLRLNAGKIKHIDLHLTMSETFLDNDGRELTEYFPPIVGVYSVSDAYLQINGQERLAII